MPTVNSEHNAIIGYLYSRRSFSPYQNKYKKVEISLRLEARCLAYGRAGVVAATPALCVSLPLDLYNHIHPMTREVRLSTFADIVKLGPSSGNNVHSAQYWFALREIRTICHPEPRHRVASHASQVADAGQCLAELVFRVRRDSQQKTLGAAADERQGRQEDEDCDEAGGERIPSGPAEKVD
jgi:hypothetical protein